MVWSLSNPKPKKIFLLPPVFYPTKKCLSHLLALSGGPTLPEGSSFPFILGRGRGGVSALKKEGLPEGLPLTCSSWQLGPGV